MLKMNVLDYRITSDSRQVIVNKARRDEKNQIVLLENKDGSKSESLGLIGYYGNLSKALIGIQRDYVLSSGTTIETIEDYRKAVEDIERQLENDLKLNEHFN